MKEKLIMLLAFDFMLKDLDDEYEKVPEEVLAMVVSKFSEIYELGISPSAEEAIGVKKLLTKEIRNLRDNLISEI